MTRLHLIDKNTGLPTGKVLTREAAERRPLIKDNKKVNQYKPVTIVLVRDLDGNILKTKRSKRKATLRGKVFYGIGEHAIASDSNDDLINKNLYDRKLRDGTIYESPQATGARGLAQELAPDGEDITQACIYFNDLINLGIHTSIDLSKHSDKSVDQQYHYFYGFLYNKDIHGNFNPRVSEVEDYKFATLNYSNIMGDMAKFSSREYRSEFKKALRNLEKAHPISNKNYRNSALTYFLPILDFTKGGRASLF